MFTASTKGPAEVEGNGGSEGVGLPESSLKRKRCARNATPMIVTPVKSNEETKKNTDVIEIRMLLLSKRVRGDLEVIWCEKTPNVADGFTDYLAKAIVHTDDPSNIAHKHRIFMYGSRIKADGSMWMNPSSGLHKKYPRRLYIRQFAAGDDRLAVLEDIRNFLQTSSDHRIVNNSTESGSTKFRNVYVVPENWDMTPPGDLQRLDTEIRIAHVLDAMNSIFRPDSWNSFGSTYPDDVDDFLSKPYPRFVKEKFGIDDEPDFNVSL